MLLRATSTTVPPITVKWKPASRSLLIAEANAFLETNPYTPPGDSGGTATPI